ncbi:LytTR family two component transcriptional regulator [Lacibacter cauensis]|uniref:LytTR family two component transcriptional regulator n=1 Tax=Lacibacter cauensis TaxID=510947 RepID=A0A562SKC1_9BACT|nr:LytTR family DNA-binding domain-containing protein [Lacibacter cauensis]TWI81286.1 LytTR family two component transcriptional regulator [Lacibacter cauensis]
MKLRCLLIDDEPPALKVLANYIASISGLEIVGQCRNAIEALDVLKHKTVDVIFLDIKMPRIIGTEFLRNLAHPPKVIFVTAYREYAVDGFELDAVDYLVKPVSFERFFKAITKLNRLTGQETTTVTGETMNPAAFVYLKVDKDMKKIFVNEIEFIESWKDYVMVFLAGGKHFLVKQSITAMENLLSEHKFMRVHRSYIVSLSKIAGYNGLSVQLAEKEIPIGRLYKQTVLEKLQAR